MSDYEVIVAENATRYSRYVVSAESEEEAKTKMAGYMETAQYLDDITYDDCDTEMDDGYRIIEVKEW